MRVFISAASNTYGQFRMELDTSARHGGLHLIIQGSSLSDHGSKPLAELDLEISAADVVVHFVGGETGAPPRQDEYVKDLFRSSAARSRCQQMLPFLWSGNELCMRPTYTQWEAYLAVLHGRRLWVCHREQESLDQMTVDGISWEAHLNNLRSCGLARSVRQFVNDGWFACELFGQLIDEKYLQDRKSALSTLDQTVFHTPKPMEERGAVDRSQDLHRIYGKNNDWTEVRLDPHRPGDVGHRIWFKLNDT